MSKCDFNKVSKHSRPNNKPNKSSKYSKQSIVSLINLVSIVIFNINDIFWVESNFFRFKPVVSLGVHQALEFFNSKFLQQKQT